MRRLLVPLLDSDEDRFAVLHAVEVARGLGAHVTVMFSGGHLSALVSTEPPAHSRVRPKLQIEARSVLAERTEAARQFLEALVREKGLRQIDAPSDNEGGTVQFEALRGAIEDTVQEAAVVHDLVVFYRDIENASGGVMGFSVIKSALQRCGRPLLILPRELPHPFGSRVAIGWNGSIEGAHAVTAALPWLKAAQSVHIVTVGTPETSTDQASRLQNYLLWHGVRGIIQTVEPSTESVGTRLLASAGSVGANLLVLGAYTHSRITQTILGGATHDVLAKARIPVLLSN